ncbi:hypothetical protein J421_1811 [Gemmatirosa kalamazoonensis]|uniref:Uncharacterized protein n=1 Tax=Gemmatirosa kalamazoonensis TaxID=861299 RepID=W0RIW2_9BACT|nr:DUF6209 family protein [Gemmatirosa kalamazoonensis]AHG89348.1 hypothetical protein J421_1811 [Gemmatirosa kalamazoonensis]
MSARNPTVPDAAVLAFLDGWRELQHGDITAGGSLVVRYEPSRFRASAKEIVGYARFLPGGQIRHATLRERRAPRTTAVAAEIAVPPETDQVELWFQCVDADGETVWDSRFGENYRFEVVRPRPRPTDSLHARAGATVDAALITVAEDAAVKENAFESRPGYPSNSTSLQTSLHVAARVRRPVDPDGVWVDVHFFDAQATLIHGDTLPLRRAGPSDADHDLFVLDGVLYQGSVATPGSVTPRPDVRSVQYRLYCQVGDRIVTDGVLHRCFLATDAVSG